MITVLDDVEKITCVKKHVLMKIANSMGYAIVDNVVESIHGGEGKAEFDIGIGVLTIDVYDDTVHYYFKPSSVVENGIISAINDNENILEDVLISGIDKHIYKTYKDML